MFETVIALADEFAQRIERSVGKSFENVPASDRVSRTEYEWLYAETERLITETFGPDSPQMRYWKTSREADSKSAWDLFPNDQWRPWLYSMQRTVATLQTLDSQPSITHRRVAERHGWNSRRCNNATQILNVGHGGLNRPHSPHPRTASAALAARGSPAVRVRGTPRTRVPRGTAGRSPPACSGR